MNRLKDLREDRDLKQKDIADMLGISQQYYQCYESGKHELPLRHCITLAKYYNVSIDYLCGIIPLPRSLTGDPSPAHTLSDLIKNYENADLKIKKAVNILLELD